jgi:Na+/phosphate symporter
LDAFFHLVSVFALFFGIAGIVFSTEISKRCQLLIEERLNEAEAALAEKAVKQDRAIAGATSMLARTAKTLEDTEMAQTREINAIRDQIEPLLIALEKAEEEKRQTAKRKLAVNGR